MKNLHELYAEAIDYIANRVDNEKVLYAASNMSIEQKPIMSVCPSLVDDVARLAADFCELNGLEEGAYLNFGDEVTLSYDVIDKVWNEDKWDL